MRQQNPIVSLFDQWSRRVEFPALQAMAITLAAQFNPTIVLVEDKASGQSLIQELKRDTRLPIHAIKVDSDKVSRAFAVTPLIETGRVFLPESAPWLTDYIDSMASFTNAAYDDDVDSTTQALNYMRGGGADAWVSYYKGLSVANREEGPAMVRLRAPQGMGGLTLEDGKGCFVDADGVVTVPFGVRQSAHRRRLRAG